MAKIGSFLILFLGILPCVWAQVTVQLQVDKNEMGVDEALVASVVVTSQKDVDIQDPKVPSLEDMRLTNTWKSSSTQSQLMQTPQGMQFKTTRQNIFNYEIQPNKAGDLKLGAFTVVVDGKSYTTEPVYIKVDANSSGRSNKPRTQNPNNIPTPFGEEDDSMEEAQKLFNEMLQRHLPNAKEDDKFRTQPRNLKESFFVQVELDKTSAYEGEQILANWYIYVRGDLLALDRLKFPSLKGFWKEDIEVAPSINFEIEVINGVTYRKALIASHALFPIKPGPAVIDEYQIKATVNMAADILGSFGFGRPYTATKSSERVKINVKPLPAENKPKDFAGAVGQFSVSAKVEGEKHFINQPLSLKIRFEGYGNAKLIELPLIEYPQGLEYYDTKKESKFFRNGLSYKDFEVILVPRSAGTITIPSFTVSLFDPKKAQYYQKSTEPITVNIEVDPNAKNETADVRLKSDTPKPEAALALPAIQVHPSEAIYASVDYRIWLGGFATLVCFFLIQFSLLMKKVDAKTLLKRKADQRLKEIQKIASQSQIREVGTQTINLFLYVLSEVSGQTGAYEEVPKMLEKLPPSVRKELAQPIQKYLEEMHMLGFAPEEALNSYKQGSRLKELVSQGESLLKKILNLNG